MSKRLSDDEKRVFSDQVTLLKNENERLTDYIEDLQTENDSLVAKLETRIEALKDAAKGGEQNTILLIEYAEPVYAKKGYSLTGIACALKND